MSSQSCFLEPCSYMFHNKWSIIMDFVFLKIKWHSSNIGYLLNQGQSDSGIQRLKNIVCKKQMHLVYPFMFVFTMIGVCHIEGKVRPPRVKAGKDSRTKKSRKTEGGNDSHPLFLDQFEVAHDKGWFIWSSPSFQFCSQERIKQGRS